MTRKPLYRQLYFWVLIGMLLGVLVGHLFPEKGAKPGGFTGTELKPLGDGFIRLIRMMVAPIIFTTVVVGMAGMGNLKRIGRIGVKSFIYFEVMTTLALVIGWVVAKVFQPGAGMNADVSTLNIKDIQGTLSAAQAHHTVADFFLNIFPCCLESQWPDWAKPNAPLFWRSTKSQKH
jgi:aerobic C4-dicarboxylate transport protein